MTARASTKLTRSSMLLWAVTALGSAYAQQAVGIDPDNPRYLWFRNKPLALISASEHYGSVINRPFDYEKYLADASSHKMTMTRTFLLYRELQSARNPSSPCKPESPDYLSPFARTGPGKALDGEPTYDLDQWNPEYFERLHRFLDLASKYGIVVELTVFSNTYSPDVWALNPLRAENNKQHVGTVAWEDYVSLKDKELVHRQIAYARKIMQETAEYDNIYYEICNEPGGGVAGHATPADVDAWQDEMARAMHEELQRLGRPHLLSGQQAFRYGTPNQFPQDLSFSSKTFDMVNVHPLPNTQFDGNVYDMGNFMSRELRLDQVASFCRASFPRPRPVVLDEDNTASMYRDLTGWTIHRKRAWTALLSGCHYDYIDFSITVGSERGTEASQKAIRSWMEHLSAFMGTFDYMHAKIDGAWIAGLPKHTTLASMSTDGRDYVTYLADNRELEDAGAGEPLTGTVTLSLPSGDYEVSLYSPITGESSPAVRISGGKPSDLVIPPFRQDLVIRATRR
jgi:hypothetical protein